MKLQIESVEFKNFLSFGSRVTKVPFLPGVNLVTGIDLDKQKSNGAGKSSFLETVPFALFGQVHRNIKKEQIVNWKNRRQCEVILNFKKGESVYSVLRSIKPDNFEIYKDGDLIDKPSHVKDYQKTLNEIIGINFPAFMSLIHSNINSSAKILSMKKPDKRKFMETMFGLSLYTKLNEKANSKLRTLKEKIRELELGDLANGKIVNSSELRIREIQHKIRNLRIPEAELNEARENLKDLEQDFPNNSDELESIKGRIGEIELENQKWTIIRERILSKCIPLFKSKFKVIENSLNTYKELEQDIKSLRLLEKKEGITYKEMLEKRKKVEQEYMDIYSKEMELLQEQVDITGTVERINSELSSIQNKLNLLDNEICPTCGRQFDDPNLYEDTKSDYMSCEIRFARSVEVRRNLTLQQAEVREQAEKKKLETKHIADTTLYMSSLVGSTSHLENESTIKKWKLDQIRYNNTLYNLNKVVSIVENNIMEGDTNQSLLEERQAELKYHMDGIMEIERNIKRLEEDIKLKTKMKKDLLDMSKSEDKAIRIIEQESKQNSLRSLKFAEIKDYLNFVKHICKDENIKQHAISSIMPYMNKQTNFYLSEVDYGFYTVLDKWLDAEIKGPGVVNASYGSLSGGEGRGIDIAIQFAFLDVARLQAGVFPDYLTFDELLDSSIDSEGIGKLFKIIKTRQKDDDSKIFIISHRSELDEIDDLDHIYHVIKENGYSRLEIRS